MEGKWRVSEILPNTLFLGPGFYKDIDKAVEDLNFTFVVNCTEVDFGEPLPTDKTSVKAVRVPIQDCAPPPRHLVPGWMDQAADAIASGMKDSDPRVYVHCSEGVARSAVMVIYYLMRERKMLLKDAYELVKKQREVACPGPPWWPELVLAEQRVFDKAEPSMSLQEYNKLNGWDDYT
eukprot:m.23866 g.23866  ORF g.23866 m.23866 type:complete len:178 (+) comp7549_c0_seq1:186-719(+)